MDLVEKALESKDIRIMFQMLASCIDTLHVRDETVNERLNSHLLEEEKRISK
jgi:hypothetical protein